MSSPEDPDGWVPSPGPWLPPPGVRAGENWTPSPFGMRPRSAAMPLWVRVWRQLPLLDRRAHVYMWHHGYWSVPQSIDWVPPSPDDPSSSGTPLIPYRSSKLSVRLHMLRFRTLSRFGIKWSWWIRAPAYLLIAVILGLIWGVWGVLLGVVAVELGLQASLACSTAGRSGVRRLLARRPATRDRWVGRSFRRGRFVGGAIRKVPGRPSSLPRRWTCVLTI